MNKIFDSSQYIKKNKVLCQAELEQLVQTCKDSANQYKLACAVRDSEHSQRLLHTIFPQTWNGLDIHAVGFSKAQKQIIERQQMRWRQQYFFPLQALENSSKALFASYPHPKQQLPYKISELTAQSVQYVSFLSTQGSWKQTLAALGFAVKIALHLLIWCGAKALESTHTIFKNYAKSVMERQAIQIAHGITPLLIENPTDMELRHLLKRPELFKRRIVTSHSFAHAVRHWQPTKISEKTALSIKQIGVDNFSNTTQALVAVFDMSACEKKVIKDTYIAAKTESALTHFFKNHSFVQVLALFSELSVQELCTFPLHLYRNIDQKNVLFLGQMLLTLNSEPLQNKKLLITLVELGLIELHQLPLAAVNDYFHSPPTPNSSEEKDLIDYFKAHLEKGLNFSEIAPQILPFALSAAMEQGCTIPINATLFDSICILLQVQERQKYDYQLQQLQPLFAQFITFGINQKKFLQWRLWRPFIDQKNVHDILLRPQCLPKERAERQTLYKAIDWSCATPIPQCSSDERASAPILFQELLEEHNFIAYSNFSQFSALKITGKFICTLFNRAADAKNSGAALHVLQKLIQEPSQTLCDFNHPQSYLTYGLGQRIKTEEELNEAFDWLYGEWLAQGNLTKHHLEPFLNLVKKQKKLRHPALRFLRTTVDGSYTQEECKQFSTKYPQRAASILAYQEAQNRQQITRMEKISAAAQNLGTKVLNTLMDYMPWREKKTKSVEETL